eukprot:TRINITY_DN9943_c0_g1_i2.p1 TRINITY_DN9943_c0_g1~~TRINITY_DN9943_c0_g1_i2.p1  ORF type:complete len:141 (-),score=1.48 TRINITY_DN9943_c0_g1_i2:277-699(-)
MSLIREQESVHAAIDDGIQKLVDAYSSLIDSAKINQVSRPINDKDCLEASTASAAIVTSAEALLSITHQLKHFAAVSDCKAVVTEVEAARKEYSDPAHEIDQRVQRLGAELSAALSILEEHYYMDSPSLRIAKALSESRK